MTGYSFSLSFSSLTFMCAWVPFFFLWLSYVPWYGYVTFCLPVSQMLVDIWDVSTFLSVLAYIIMNILHIFVLTYVYISCLPKSGMVRHMVTLYITLRNCQTVSNGIAFSIPIVNFENSDCCILTFTYLLIITMRFNTLVGVAWYLIVILIRIINYIYIWYKVNI